MKFVCLLLSCVFALASCRDFLEKDISQDRVLLVSPGDHYTSSSFQVIFRWDRLDGARQYELQVATPSFDSLQLVSVDTVVSSSTTTLTLHPGNYQWRVTAINNAGRSLTSNAFTLLVDSTGSLNDVIVNLSTPPDLLFSNKINQTFAWLPVTNALDYRFQLLNGIGIVVFDQTMSTTQESLSMSEGSYSWRVRAQNDFSNSIYSTRYLTIDTTPPAAPSLLLPYNGDTLNAPYKLSWTRGTSEVNPNGDSLFVYSDSLLTDLALSAYSVDTSFTFTEGTTGHVYHWFVKSIDKAANSSPFSGVRKFVFGP